MSRLRPLSAAQAANCENAREPVCRCRCRGALHGSRRTPVGRADDRTFYEQLPEDDPHHLPSEEERREMKRLRRLVLLLKRDVIMYREQAPAYSAEQAKLLEKAMADLAKIEALVLGRPA